MTKEKRISNGFIVFAIMAALVIPAALYAGSLEPLAPPAPTMRPLDELKPSWNRIIPGAPRFVDALDGSAVLDKETGLVWVKSPDATQRTWQAAMDYCTTLYLGGRMGWRLPMLEELASLVDPTQSNPSLPSGHPFSNVQANWYLSSSTYSGDSSSAWLVYMGGGFANIGGKDGSFYVWPVRGGQ